MSDQSFDLIVIGAGPGGYVAAIRGAQLGMNVACIEREHLGGICLNWGCIPTKAMLRSAEVLHLAQRATDFGLSIDDPTHDLDAIVKRSRAIAKQLSNGVGYLFRKNKVTSIMGAARLAGNGQVVVTTKDGEQTLQSDNIVVATGARARELP
ncbi:MAG: FAD-dependent oxidoreductase, partial [Pseudomonadota bacterium]